jgi:hypothetical protein
MPETSLTGIQGFIAQRTGNIYSRHGKLLNIINLLPVISLQSEKNLNFLPKIKHKHYYVVYF